MKKETQDIFTSVPAEGAVLRDWTRSILTVDIENSIGEHFHFEVKPGETNNLPTRDTMSPADKGWVKTKTVSVLVHLPLVKV